MTYNDQKLSQHKHTFAVFHGSFRSDVRCCNDTEIIHRITKVLRLSIGDTVIFFNTYEHSVCSLEHIDKKQISYSVLSTHATNLRTPQISMYICLLKKDAFFESVRQCAAMGVSHIIPVISEKIERNWFSEKDFHKCTRISIAACEQAKNFHLPKMHHPIRFEDITARKNIFVADPHGAPLQEMSHYVDNDIRVLIGPEGGFSPEEANTLTEFPSLRLTPTILRAVDAVAVIAGALSSMMYSADSKRL